MASVHTPTKATDNATRMIPADPAQAGLATGQLLSPNPTTAAVQTMTVQ
jgi:hypothetical protein